MPEVQAIQQHYRRPDLLDTILKGLAEMGKDPERLTPGDLAAVDEFHIRGRESTAETASLAQFPTGSHLVDLGCGIGGPSRHLAAEFGLRVTGIDLCDDYCEIARELATRTGLADRVQYQQADATSVPYADASFDGAWTQHASMNIEDKAAFYGELARLVRPGGLVAVYDIHGQPGQTPHYPVPWAREPSISFLLAADEIRRHLAATGLVEVAWRDDTAAATAWFVERLEKARSSAPHPLGLHVLFGPDWPEMAANIARNLSEQRIGVLQTVWRKP